MRYSLQIESDAHYRMSEPVTLPVHCAHCGGAVELQFTDWPSVLADDGGPADDALSLQTWTCPYCGAQNEGEFPDRVEWVTKRHRGLGENH